MSQVTSVKKMILFLIEFKHNECMLRVLMCRLT